MPTDAMVACEHALGVGRMTQAQQEQQVQNQQEESPTATPHMRTAGFNIYFSAWQANRQLILPLNSVMSCIALLVLWQASFKQKRETKTKPKQSLLLRQ